MVGPKLFCDILYLYSKGDRETTSVSNKERRKNKMKRFLSSSKLFIFMVVVLLFEILCFDTPVSAKSKSFSAPKISASKFNNDLGIKVTIKRTKKAQGYEVYLCPVKTISFYDGYVGDAFYVVGNSENKLDGTWHDKGKYYKQGELKSTGASKQVFYIDFMQAGTYKVKVRAYYETKEGKRKYSKYSKEKKITITPGIDKKGYKDSYDFSDIRVGDEFDFGTYEQDGNLKNGYEPITWQVLSKNDDNMLVVSKKVLDILPYNVENKDTTWESSTIRRWLNEKFILAAFNDSEKKLIAEMTLTNEDNAVYGTDGGNATKDKIFILSQQDVTNPAYGFSTSYDEKDINRRCAATKYAIAAGSGMYFDYTTKEGLGTCYWWVRTPGYKSDYGTYVHDYGYVLSDGNSFDYGYVYYSHGVRPAMFIKLYNNKAKYDVKEYTYKSSEFTVVNNLDKKYCLKMKKSNDCTLTSANIIISLARNEVYEKTEWIDGVGCAWRESDKISTCKIGYKFSDAQVKRNVCGQMAANGIPSALRLGDKRESIGHTVVVVGVKKNADLNNVSDDDLLIIDPDGGEIKVLKELDGTDTWHNGVNGGLKNNEWSIVIPIEYDWEGFKIK